MSTVAIYWEGRSDTKLFIESKKIFIYNDFTQSPLQLIDINQLNQNNRD